MHRCRLASLHSVAAGRLLARALLRRRAATAFVSFRCFSFVPEDSMPVDQRGLWQFGLLLLAVPAQYLFVKYYSSGDAVRRSQMLSEFVDVASKWQRTYFSGESWSRWWAGVIARCLSLAGRRSYGSRGETPGESPAVEVMRYLQPQGHFTMSPTPRSPRPPQLQFRVGQVVKHKVYGYRGVIVGYDAKAQAPKEWLDRWHPKDKPYLASMPHYAVLVDVRDRPDPQTTYVPEEYLVVAGKTEVRQPLIGNYFDAFDGRQYILKPALRVLYPHD